MRLTATIAGGIVAAVVLPLAATEASTAPPVRFTFVQYDSPGKDNGSNESLNAEWIRVSNHSNKTRALSGWTILDPEGHVYTFPTFKLKPGKSVRVHTGSGGNTNVDLYWGQDGYVWNNTGDKAKLKNKAKDTVDTCKWADGDGNTGC